MFIRSVILLIVVLHGCIAMAPKEGNFLHVSGASEKRMADDAVKRLTALYPPARTRFDFYQQTTDVFGKTLVEALRAKGYAVSEAPGSRPAQDTKTGTEPAKPAGTTLSYRLDQPSPELYLVALHIGYIQTLQRAYTMASDGALYPAGAWTRGQ